LSGNEKIKILKLLSEKLSESNVLNSNSKEKVVEFAPGFVNYKKSALDSQPQVIKFTSCLTMVGGSLRVLRLPPPLKLVAMI
jgi:hypothetical protein